MRILLIHQSFMSLDEPGHTRHFEMAQFLRARGHELVAVASGLNYQTGQRTDKRRGIYSEQMLEGVRVLWAYIYPSLHHSYSRRIISFLSFAFSSVWAALLVKDVDLVMGTTPQFFQAFSAWIVALIKRKPFLLEVRDLWPEFAVDMKVLTNPLMISLARWMERFLYIRATHILVNSPAYKEYVHSKGVPNSKITFIPYGADVDMFNPNVSGLAVRKQLGLEDKFVVLYAGALGEANDIYTLLCAAKHLNNEKHIRFVLWGDGKERPKLQSETERLMLENVIFAGVCPKKEMPYVIASSDVCLAILQNVPMFRTTYPNKVFDYMAAARPTVLVIDGVIREVIESSKGGVFVEPANHELLAKTILDLSRDPQWVKQMGTNARAYLVKNLDRRDKLDETLKLLTKLVHP